MHRARVEAPTDTFRQNNELSGFTVVKDKPRVLMIGAHPDDEDTHLLTFLARGRHVGKLVLTLDDQLDYRVDQIEGVPFVASTFDRSQVRRLLTVHDTGRSS